MVAPKTKTGCALVEAIRLRAIGKLSDVRRWHKADVIWAQRGVRFQGESGHDADWLSLPSLTLSGHGETAHSITSSARASKEGGTVRPSALAVFMLIASSNLVGCSTGRSEGLAPFRILST